MNISQIIESRLKTQELSFIFFCSASLAFLALLLMSVWQWHSDWQLIQVKPQITAAANNTTELMIAAIPNEHLFGQSIKGDMPISSLQLQLTGISQALHDKNKTKAYISIAGSNSKIYAIGDTLPDGVKIYDINKDTIVLENNGRLEKLSLAREKLQFKPKELLEA